MGGGFGRKATRCAVADETLKESRHRSQRETALNRAHQREPTSQSKLGISVQIQARG
jgi:hypothetical protein